MIELLAPAGNLKLLKTAIDYGADSVYCAGKHFGARAYAGNFSTEELREGIGYAHAFGAKVYVTVNTLIKNNEFPGALDFISKVYSLGADAIIVQDFGLAKIIKERLPGIEVHGSTQTTLHNSKAIEESPFDRVILAREMRKEEIRELSTKKSLEIFVHGALCFSFSGQCLMSSLIGGRSGNRGRCAQACRKKYNGTYALSTADLCLISRLPEIIRMGIHSIKIEGRMKSENYVKTVVSEYRKAIDSFYKGSFHVNDMESLMLAYNRTFTKGFFDSDKILATNSPSNRGIYAGEIKDNYITLETGLKKGDGIFYGNKGRIISFSANKGDKISLKGNGKVFRTSTAYLAEKRKIPLDIRIFNSIDVELKTRYEKKVLNFPVKLETARNKATSADDVKRIFSKVNHTPFAIRKLECSLPEDIFIPFSVLTEIKNNSLSSMMEPKQREKVSIELPKRIKKESGHSIHVRVRNLPGIAEAKDADFVYYNVFNKDLEQAVSIAKKNNINLWFDIPAIVFDHQIHEVESLIKKYNPGGLLIGNPAFLRSYKNIHLDYSFNLFNDFTLAYWNRIGIISPELNLKELGGFCNKDFIVFAHGYPIMMKTRVELKLNKLEDNKACFKVRKNPAGYTEIINSLEIGLFNKVNELQKAGFNRFFLDLDKDVSKTINTYRRILKGEKVKPVTGYTTGHLYRGVD